MKHHTLSAASIIRPWLRVLPGLFWLLRVLPAPAADLPTVSVRNVRCAFSSGEHNAFTDLVRFSGRYYLTFRSCPDGHMVHPTSSIIVLASDDLQQWEQVHRFRVRHRDTRDPHFLVFRNRLFVYTGTWYTGETSLPPDQYDVNLHLGYAVWTEDGRTWTDPILLEGTFGHYIWRAAAFDGKAYLCARRKVDFEVTARGEPREMEALMLESDDGLIWRKRAAFRHHDGDETAFLFSDTGRITAIARSGGRRPALLLRSDSPWTNWERIRLDRYIGGPLLARWGTRLVVGGRKITDTAKTSLYWLHDDRLHEFAELPSGGDTSYPGFVALSPLHAVVSWYSSHTADEQGRPVTAVWLADLHIDEQTPPSAP